MMGWRRMLRDRRARGDRGVVLIEAAIAFPVFFLLVLGIIEYGFYMSASSTTVSSAREGARLGSAQMGTASDKSAMADTIRDTVVTDLHALSRKDTPQRLWVYKAFSDGSPCSDLACATGTGFSSCPSAVCYQYTTWNASTRTFTAKSGGWVTTDACGATLDTIGVHLQVTHNYLSRVVGSTASLSERSVLRLEPLPTSQCAP